MNEHPSISSRMDNVVFLRLEPKRGSTQAAGGAQQPHRCSSCLDWSGEAGTSGRCLADCGVRITPAQGCCGSWRRPPALTLVR